MPTPPAAETITTDSPGGIRALVLYRCQTVRPWISSASAVSSETPSGIGKVRSAGAVAYSA